MAARGPNPIAQLQSMFKEWQTGGNPIPQLQAKFKDLETGYKAWLDKQSLPLQTAAVTATGAALGAAIGGLMGTLNGLSFPSPPPPYADLNPKVMASLQLGQDLAGGPLVQARNVAVVMGVNAGIICVMKRLRGKEDLQSNMVAGFGSGAMFSFMSGMGGPNHAGNIVTSGLLSALVQGGLFKLLHKNSQLQAEDELYKKTRSMLISLGLQNYEKYFKKGLLTDSTLPLLTDSALRDARIPPGPRLIILDRIQRSDPLGQSHVSI